MNEWVNEWMNERMVIVRDEEWNLDEWIPSYTQTVDCGLQKKKKIENAGLKSTNLTEGHFWGKW